MIRAEYIWIDGKKPVANLRSKTKILDLPGTLDRGLFSYPVEHDLIPLWGFDGSSTDQAEGSDSDCVLRPVRVTRDPLRGGKSLLVLCEVMDVAGSELVPGKNNFRNVAAIISERYKDEESWFGIEQEYTFFKGRSPLGWPEGGYPAPQGPFYCGIGADQVYGRDIVENHMEACLGAGLKLSGVNAEVMPGQWEFQIGPGDPLLVSDHLWLARYLLYRIAENFGVNIKLDPKPIDGDWNGAGAHTNFSTKLMREGFIDISGLDVCHEACNKIGADFEANGFPSVYGHGYEKRLTGAHETCSYEEFRYGIADRTASVRIPLHVEVNKKGYIEDRRPCANIDPYQVVSYLVETTCS